jgi:hypothetical protein
MPRQDSGRSLTQEEKQARTRDLEKVVKKLVQDEVSPSCSCAVSRQGLTSKPCQ